MKSDSYPRYIRSEMYKEFLNGSKKKVSKNRLKIAIRVLNEALTFYILSIS